MKRILAIVVTLALVVGLAAAFGAGWRGVPGEREREHVLRAAYSHPEIIGRVGTVRNVSVALKQSGVPFGKRPQDWSRTVSGDVIGGEVRLMVLGTTEGGFVKLIYTYHESADRFAVVRLDVSALGSLPREADQAKR